MKTNWTSLLKTTVASAFLGAMCLLPSPAMAAETKTVTGEVVDLMCYLDHGARGSGHAECAQSCIQSGGPVGLLTKDNQLYLVIGEHKPMNDKLAAYAGKTITVTGKIVEKAGMKMIENTKIDK